MILLKLEMTNLRDLQLLTIPDLIRWPKLPVELEVSTIGQHTFKSLNQLCEAANFHSNNVLGDHGARCSLQLRGTVPMKFLGI